MLRRAYPVNRPGARVRGALILVAISIASAGLLTLAVLLL